MARTPDQIAERMCRRASAVAWNIRALDAEGPVSPPLKRLAEGLMQAVAVFRAETIAEREAE